MSNHQPYNREFAPPGYGPHHPHVPPHPHPGMPPFVVPQQFQNPMAFQQRIPAVGYPTHIPPQMHHQPPQAAVPVVTRRERKPIVLQNPVTKEEIKIEGPVRKTVVETPVIQAPPIVPQPQLAPPVTVSAPPRRSKIIISRPDDAPPKKTDETTTAPSTDAEQKPSSTTSSSVASPAQETKQPEPSEQTSTPTPSDKEKEEVKETKEEEKASTNSEEPAKTQETVVDKPATPELADKVPESATEEAAPSKDKEETPAAAISTPEVTEKTPESTETPSEATSTTLTATTTPDASEKPEEKSEATPEADGEGEEEEWEKKDVDTMKEEFIEQVKGTNSSLNDSGIKFYSADFLMKFRDVEVCKEKPIEFRDINFGPTNNFSARNNLRNSRDGNMRQSTDRGPKGRGPRYGGGDDGPRSDYKRGGKKNNRGGNNRQPSAPSRPIIKPAANEHEKNVRKVVSILNKIAPDTFDKLSTQIAALVTEDLLQEITEKIFEKAVAEPTYSNMYAKLCERLVKQANGGEENIATFRRALLNLCQNEFKQRREQLGLDNSDVQVNENADFLLRKRMRGNMEFVGELFNLQGLLSAKVIGLCFQELLSNPDNVNIEAFCKLLTTVGRQLDRIAPSKVKPLFDQIQPLVTSSILESRIKFMIKDLIDLWKNNWVPRREQDRPQTIAEIHSAAEHAKTESYKQEQRQLRKSTFGNQQSSSSIKSNNNNPNRGAAFVNNLKSSKGGIPLNASTNNTNNASLKTSSDEWNTVSSSNKGNKKGKKSNPSSQTKAKTTPSDSTSNPNRFGALDSSLNETDSPLRAPAPTKSGPGNTKTDAEKAKNRIYVDLETWYSPDGDLKDTLENIRETLTFPDDTEALIDIFFQYIVDKNVKSTDKLVELIQALQSELAQSGVEASVVTFFNTLPDIIEDLPLIPARMAQLIAPLSPSLLKNFAFLNDVIDGMTGESPSIVSTFVTELINSLKKSNPNYDNELSGLKQEYFSLALGSQFKQKIANSSACAEWINSLSEKERADPKLLLAIAEHVNRFFFKSSLTATPSDETIADEKDSLRKIQPVLQGLLKSGADEEFFNALHSVLGKRSEDLYQRVRKEIEQFLKE